MIFYFEIFLKYFLNILFESWKIKFDLEKCCNILLCKYIFNEPPSKFVMFEKCSIKIIFYNVKWMIYNILLAFIFVTNHNTCFNDILKTFPWMLLNEIQHYYNFLYLNIGYTCFDSYQYVCIK